MQVRLTGVADPRSPAYTHLEGAGRNLEEMARDAGVQLEFKAVRMDLEAEESLESLESLRKAAGVGVMGLAVNFSFQLHRMPDESVSTSNPRDRLLRAVRAMRPRLVTLVEHEASTSTSPFYPRLVEALSYFGAVLESLEGFHAPRVRAAWRARLARDIMNIVSCEGVERWARYEVFGKWKSRMAMAGFEPVRLRRTGGRIFDGVLPGSFFSVREDSGALFLDWRDRALVAASAWK